MEPRPFIKMHGLGNDFVVIDARRAPFPLDDGRARRIADRRTGVGCDQLLILEPPSNGSADVFMRIRNHEGGEVEACGNGTRCVAALVMAEAGRDALVVETTAGLLRAERAGPDRIAVDMGRPGLNWDEVPIARAMDTLHLDLTQGPLSDPVATSIGNPHATFFVEDAEAVDLAILGPKLEHDPLFPARANIGIAQLVGPDRLRLRVWERGVGITRACGTGACAVLVAGVLEARLDRSALIHLPGGDLTIEWPEADGDLGGPVFMTGPATFV
ncbi:MAG: diaminopimelate epimerase, partial [Kiloniellales bacterium]|nr:diaminopimelate epimerase [Kiloniellales bacterium]